MPSLFTTWSFSRGGHDAAWAGLARGGSSTDAVEQACRVAEADPGVDSVGFGGLADAAGNVTLDAAIMRSPSDCGSVCALRRHLHAVSVARRVMENTPFMMLVAEGADAFADAQGFEPAKLVSEAAEAKWRDWKQNPAVVDRSRDRSLTGGYAPTRPIDTGRGELFNNPSGHDTICALAMDAAGTLAGACSTSGLPYTMPDRVGDAPLIGAGLYVDPDHGAATATGTGELVMGLCSSFLVVESMRRGADPLDALCDALGRIRDAFDLQPEHQVAMTAMRPDGTRVSAALKSGFKAVITDEAGTRIVDPDAVLLPDAPAATSLHESK